MSSFSKIWDFIRGSKSLLYPSFSIDQIRVLTSGYKDEEFIANDAYFEIRIAEQFLENRREYWNEYNPLTVVLINHIFNEKRQDFPFVVGPALLKSLELLDGSERVRYRNTRVIGPTPYFGDDVSLFVGLFRVRTRDWAKQSLSLLETFAKSFDSTKLSNYLNIAGPLMDGINSFFGMGSDMDFRLGQRMSFTDPSLLNTSPFTSGYSVMLRTSNPSINDKTFWVKDEELFHGTSENDLKIYKDSDYVLYYITHMTERGDYATFNFNKEWSRLRDLIWIDNMAAAQSGFGQLISMIRKSPELINKDKNRLSALYTKLYRNEIDAKNATRLAPPALPAPTSLLTTPTEDGLKAFDMAINEFSNNFDNKTINAFSVGKKFYEEATIIPTFEPKGNIDEGYIEEVFQMPILNQPVLVEADPNEFADMLISSAPSISGSWKI
ncbi:MAG: hypothetical protein JRC89_05540 [Deltaproteobacteria bacterium]|nr:hypothetical protein [Deltaproteobacteria bacterium]